MIDAFNNFNGGEVIFSRPLKDLTTFKIGGNSEIFVEPYSVASAITAYKTAKKHAPVFILGAGSNILVSDKGVKGTVISVNRLDRINLINKNSIYFECGAKVSAMLNFCVKENLTGLEFLAGIPATIGGLVAVGAGAFNENFCSYLTSVTVLRDGVVTDIEPDFSAVGYRQTFLKKDDFLLSGVVKLKPAGEYFIKNRIFSYINRRLSQPKGFSAGSIFKNPDGDYAGRLIEKAGLKGFTVGGAKISEKHANFIINYNSAKSLDIVSLISVAKTAVYEKFGVQLLEEIRFVGEFDDYYGGLPHSY